MTVVSNRGSRCPRWANGLAARYRLMALMPMTSTDRINARMLILSGPGDVDVDFRVRVRLERERDNALTSNQQKAIVELQTLGRHALK